MNAHNIQLRRLLKLAAAHCVCFANTTRLVLQTTNTSQEALTDVVPVDILVVVVHVPAVGVVGIVLRATPPVAVVADTAEIAT